MIHVVSNDEVAAQINNFGEVTALYFINESAGNLLGEQSDSPVHKLGVYVDGQLSWLDDGAWEVSQQYAIPTLAVHTSAIHRQLKIALEIDSFIDSRRNVFWRSLHVINHSEQLRTVRVFAHQGFKFCAPSSLIRAEYIKSARAIMHYSPSVTAFVASSHYDGSSFDDWSVGAYKRDGFEGTYVDASDGELAKNSYESGVADSTIRMTAFIPGLSSNRFTYHLSLARTPTEAYSLQTYARKQGFNHAYQATGAHWHEWIDPATQVIAGLSPSLSKRFIAYLLLVRTHLFKAGVVECNQGELVYDTHATLYSLWPLLRLGKQSEVQQYFERMAKKYTQTNQPPSRYCDLTGRAVDNGSPDIDKGILTFSNSQCHVGGLLFLFGQLHHLHSHPKQLHSIYKEFSSPITTQLSGMLDAQHGKKSTQLSSPAAIYDLALLSAGFASMADVAEAFKDSANMIAWRTQAEALHESAAELPFSVHNQTEQDLLQSAQNFYGLFMYGVVRANDTILVDAASTIAEYTGRLSQDSPHRLKIHCWLAQYYIETNNSKLATEQIHALVRCQPQSPSDAAEILSTLLDTIT
ncbi:hypothetical protein FJZ39_01215 [Candidatus Saccharibacteria bacterium]|nr:hypothetical protein [Candidatus Saccharibacteria bacterium]